MRGCVVAAVLAALVAAASAAPSTPNIVMLFVDDLGYGDVGFNGHPSTYTPNLDALAYSGKVLTTWYSGCPVCSGSRAALMTGRQFARVGVPGVFGPTVDVGLPLNETTVANIAKKKNYRTGIVGKWHLGQRPMFLPGARGFDEYLGIPYSDDMGEARATPCNGGPAVRVTRQGDDASYEDYAELNYVGERDLPPTLSDDPAGRFLPLVHQISDGNGNVNTTVLEQPLDFSTLGSKYAQFATDFIDNSVAANQNFFLYMPFSHVHTTASNQPEKQYAGCDFQNTTRRGKFGDALAEVDAIVGKVVDHLDAHGIRNNTVIFMTADNGPWLVQGKSGGSVGLFYGRDSGYWNVGKGSTWEGGIREAAFVNWPGMVAPQTRSSEVCSSLDFLPTVASLLGVPLPTDRVYDGRDLTDVILDKGPSKHDVLFFYGGHAPGHGGPAAARYGSFKAHWWTGPGLSGCDNCTTKYYPDPPLIFNVDEDPSEAYPLTQNNTSPPPELQAVYEHIMAAYKQEVATFTYGKLVPPPAAPGEKPGEWGVCCSRAEGCDCNGKPSSLLAAGSP